MRRPALALCLLLVLCGCVARADGDASMLAADVYYVHGITVTSTGAPVGGGTVELYRGSTRVAGGVMPSHAFGFSPSETAGVYQVRYTPPAGWKCVDVLSAGVGWQYPGGCVGQIALPEQAPSLGPDLVFVLAYAATPPPVPTATITPTPTLTRTPTLSKPTPTATAPAEVRPTPTRVCENAMLVIPYEDRLTIREQAARELFRLEEELDWFDDPTLIRGVALFNVAPLSQRFAVTGAGGVVYDCRAFANQIIAIREGAAPCETGVVFWDSPWQWPGHVYEGR